MPQQTISNEIALRIGLAARVLPDTEPARLLRVLADVVGLPPTADRLGGLTMKAFKQGLDGEFADIDGACLKQAVALLKGEGETAVVEDLPSLDPYADGDMPGSIRVACASNANELLDGHFGSCRRFLIYQVSPQECRLIDIRAVSDAGVDDKNAYRSELIGDCQVLYIMSIGGPAAAKVVKADIHPIKIPEGGVARGKVEKLMPILDQTPPPWLAKVMGLAPEERVRFDREEAEA